MNCKCEGWGIFVLEEAYKTFFVLMFPELEKK